MRKCTSIFLILLITFSLTFPSLASIATPANAEFTGIIATSSDWDVHEAADRLVNYASIMPLSTSTSFPVVQNTVDYSGIRLVLRYYDMSGVTHDYSVMPESDGHFAFVRPSDYASFGEFHVRIEKAALPDKGDYKLQIWISPDAGGPNNWTSVSAFFARTSANASGLGINIPVDLVQQDGFGSVCTTSYIDLTGNVLLYVFHASSFVLNNNYNGTVRINFTVANPSTFEPDVADPFVAPPEQATAENTATIAQNTSYLINGMNDVADTLEEIVATISNQLAALWNQMYNIMHKEQLANDDKNTNQITQNATQNTQDIIDSLDQNISDQIDNDNENTDTIVNGYDGSGIDSDNDRLPSSLDDYAAAEDSLMDDVNDGINAIDFDYDFSGQLSVIATVSAFLQGIYERSGNFQVVINVGLILALGSCLIGVYRLKGGG